MVRNALAEKFPYTPVVHTLGNNDVMYHYQAPALDQKSAFYSYLYAIWFSDVPSNTGFSPYIRETFLQGGYYMLDISANLAVIALNTLYFYADYSMQDEVTVQD